ncbi:MAG: hypothetical protein HYX53_11910 [Chloroflexi bacterium]|nr:hypothetical protein [Chloroflexota bacterium]
MIAAGLVVVALAQVAVAPLFPLAAAVPDYGLAALMAVVVYAGPRSAMWAVPWFAIVFSFASDRSAGMLLLAYVPLLPASYLLSESHLPLNRYAQTLACGAGTGVWARLLLALGPIAQGASPQMGTLVGNLLISGLLLDIVLLTFVYFPLKAVGFSPRPMSLQRTGWL